METASDWKNSGRFSGKARQYECVLQSMVGTPSDGQVLIDQFEQANFRPFERSPEERLMFAILEDAVLLLVRGVPNGKGTTMRESTRRRIFDEARRWVEAEDMEGIHTFENIVTTLFPGWSVKAARAELLSNSDQVWKRLQAARLLTGRYSRYGRKYYLEAKKWAKGSDEL